MQARQASEPQVMTAPDDMAMLPAATSGLEMAPAIKPDAPKMALAAPALALSLSKAIAVNDGCMRPKAIIMYM